MASAERGVAWLAATQRPDGSWDEPQFTGTGFPGDFYINYHLYRLVFPVSALGRYLAGCAMSRLTVCAPLRRRGPRAVGAAWPRAADDVEVIRTRLRSGPGRSRSGAGSPHRRRDMLAVGGVGGGLTSDLRVGDIVVALGGHATAARPSAARRRRCWPASSGGPDCAARAGPIATVDHLLRDGEHAAACGHRGHRGRHGVGAAAGGRRGQPGRRAPGDLGHPGARGAQPAHRDRRPGGAAVAAAGSAGARPAGLRPSARGRCCWRARGRSAPGWSAPSRSSSWRSSGTAPRSTCASRSCTTRRWSADLERAGAIFVDELSEVPDGAKVVFSAHGVSPEVAAGGGAARPGRRRRDLPAGRQGARRGAPVRRRRLPGRADRARRARGGGGHAGRGARRHGAGRDRRRRGPAASGRSRQGRLPDADHAGRRRGQRHRRRDHRAVPGRDRAGQRRHLLRDHQPAAGSAGHRGAVRPGPGRRLGQFLQLPAPGRDGRARRDHRLPGRRPGGHQLGWLAGASTVGIAAGASAPPAIVGQIVAALAASARCGPRTWWSLPSPFSSAFPRSCDSRQRTWADSQARGSAASTAST